jgi:hypothetical protein
MRTTKHVVYDILEDQAFGAHDSTSVLLPSLLFLLPALPTDRIFKDCAAFALLMTTIGAQCARRVYFREIGA